MTDVQKDIDDATAAVIHEVLDDWPTHLAVRLATLRIAEGMASEFAEDNSRFSRGRFLTACGFREDEL